VRMQSRGAHRAGVTTEKAAAKRARKQTSFLSRTELCRPPLEFRVPSWSVPNMTR